MAANKYRNFVAADVMIDGKSRTVFFKNTPKKLHSEKRLIQWSERMTSSGHQIKVNSVFSERFPCGRERANCISKLEDAFGSDLQVFYSIFGGPIR